MEYENFSLRLSGDRRGLRIRVFESPFGQAAATTEFRPLVTAFDGKPLPRDFAQARRLVADLKDTLFPEPVLSLWQRSRGACEGSRRRLRLRIHFDPRDPRERWLAGLPWELITESGAEGPRDSLALHRDVSVVRYLDTAHPGRPVPRRLPLRVLGVAASPRALHALDLETEWRKVDAVRAGPGVEAESRLLRGATRKSLLEACSSDRWDVVHFMGHGFFSASTGQGTICLETESGGPDELEGETFASLLRQRGTQLVVLNACWTAAGSSSDSEAIASFAGLLVDFGIPAVVAMQAPLRDALAKEFSEVFYRNLILGKTVDEAVTEARLGLYNRRPRELHWALPVLFLRSSQGRLWNFEADQAGQELPSAQAITGRLDLETDLLADSSAAGYVGKASADGPVSGDAEVRAKEIRGSTVSGVISGCDP